MNTTEISTQEELDNFFNGGGGPGMGMYGSFVDDRIISWDIGSRLGNSYFADDFVLEFEVDYTSSQSALEKAFSKALKEAGFSGRWSSSGDVFSSGQVGYEAAVNEGQLTAYNGVDNGSGIAISSSDLPSYSELTQITDTWAQTIILANNNITIPAGSTSAGIELVASIAENAEIPECEHKVKEFGEYSAEFNMDITEISTQGELDNFVTGQAGPAIGNMSGSFVDDRIISWDIGSRFGNSYFSDDFVLEFEVDYTSQSALEAFSKALKEAGFSGGWSSSGDVFSSGQVGYEAAVNEGRLTAYNGVDSNGSGIAISSSDLPSYSG